MDFRVITVDQFRKRREFRHLFRIFQRHLRQLPERAAIAGVEIDAGGMGFVEKEPFRIHHRHNQQQMLFQYPGRLRIVAGEKFDQPEGAGGTGFFGTAVKAGDQHDIFFIVRYRGVGRADEKQRITGVIFGKSFDLQVRRPFFIIAQQRFKLLRFQPGMVADIPPVGIVFQFRRQLSEEHRVADLYEGGQGEYGGDEGDNGHQQEAYVPALHRLLIAGPAFRLDQSSL